MKLTFIEWLKCAKYYRKVYGIFYIGDKAEKYEKETFDYTSKN